MSQLTRVAVSLPCSLNENPLLTTVASREFATAVDWPLKAADSFFFFFFFVHGGRARDRKSLLHAPLLCPVSFARLRTSSSPPSNSSRSRYHPRHDIWVSYDVGELVGRVSSRRNRVSTPLANEGCCVARSVGKKGSSAKGRRFFRRRFPRTERCETEFII